MPASFAEGLVGIVLDDRYRLDAVLGEGGMGAVYRAHHLAMDRRVAVKLLKPHLTSDDHALQRFMREARSTMKVESDHAVKVLDFGITPHRDYYMVLEYLDGRTVQQELDVDGPFAPARVIHIAKQVLHALGAAHARGLIHRDIKPDNILLMRAGDDADFAKVLDFGVAKLMDGAAQSSKSALSITQAGMVFGTPEFMSPEQACGQALDGRSDLYSLAATMFAMLTGCGMYRAKAPIEWLSHHARTPPPHLAEGLPALAPFTALDKALQRCLAKKRDDRPADAEAMIGLLAAVEQSLPDGRAESAAHSNVAKTVFSPSTYIPALDPAATLAPEPLAAGAVDTVPARPRAHDDGDGAAAMEPTTTGMVAAMAGRRRGLWLVLGGSAIVGVLVTTALVATRKRSRDTATVAKQAEPATPRTQAEAGLAVALAPDAGQAAVIVEPPVDAGVITVDAASRPVVAQRPRVNAEAAAHVAAAEAARASGNRLRQLAEADAALQADPRNARARFLAADALIAAGDLDRGCKYLRDLGKNPTAVARAKQAGCSTH